MVLRGWIVLLLGFVIGVLATYLAFAFVLWDLQFFIPEKADPRVRGRLLIWMAFGGLICAFPFISWSVDLDIRNKERP